ncbi:MAG: hypothetical protein INQ03_05680 [Candidatus Heimdallarchaeota archaeon]|nr:hypothetical protein [Candidatus Heimdallarchaeota archaeon]
MAKVKQNSINFNLIVILSILYAAVSLIVDDLQFIPRFDSEAEFRLGIFMPGLTAVVFGSLIGGLTAGFGNLIIDIYHSLLGDIVFGWDRVLGAIANFLGAYVAGKLSVELQVYFASIRDFLRSKSTWKYILQETMAAILGLALVTGVSIGSILYFYSGLPYELAELVAIQIFFVNSLVLLIFMPISLIVYYGLKIRNESRTLKQDEKNREMKTFIVNNGVEITRIWLPYHSFFKNQYTQINIEFKNTLKITSRFIIEIVSGSLSDMHTKKSVSMTPGSVRTIPFHIFVHQEQDEVTLQIQVRAEEEGKFKQNPKYRSSARVEAVAVRRKGDKLTEFSVANVIVMAISILWSNIIEIIGSGIQIIENSYLLLLSVLIIEIILFIPFIYFRYNKYKHQSENLGEFSLSFESDLTTHNYLKVEEKSVSKKIPMSIIIFINFFTTLLGMGLILFLIIASVQVSTGISVSYLSFLKWIALGLLMLSVIWYKIVHNSREEDNTVEYFEVGESDFIQEFNPLNQFKIYQTTLVELKLKNPYEKGMRVRFSSTDTISPTELELHCDSDEIVSIRVALTPEHSGDSELIIMASPMYDSKGIPIHTDEYTFQKINFVALGVTALGLTESQYEMIKQITGYGSVAGALLIGINNYLNLGITDIATELRDLLPIIALLQIPFIYLYYYFTNRFKRTFKL